MNDRPGMVGTYSWTRNMRSFLPQRLRIRQFHEDGFTLVELLIVVLILGALASTAVVASGGFRTKGVQQACAAAASTYETAFESYRADNADSLYPTNDAQVVPTYAKRAGGSSATSSGVPEIVVVRGKGWSFAISYGLASSGAPAGSATAPVFSSFAPNSCALALGGSGSGPGGSPLTCPTGQWTVSYWNSGSASLPTGIPSGPAAVTQPCSPANRPNLNIGGGSPAAGVNADYVTARWTGTLTLVKGSNTFTTVSDDGIRVSVGGASVIDNWTLHGATTNSGVFTAPADGAYEVTLDFYEWTGQWVTVLQSP